MRRPVRVAAAITLLLLAAGCRAQVIVDCVGPGVQIDISAIGKQFLASGDVTACVDSACTTYRHRPDRPVSSPLFISLPRLGVTPRTISVTVTEHGKTLFSATSHEKFPPHHGGQCTNGLFFVRVDAAGRIHGSEP